MAITPIIGLLLLVFVGFLEAAPQQNLTDENNARILNERAGGEILEMRLVGIYEDPVTGVFKRYYTDNPLVPRTWLQSREYCQSLTMEAFAPLSNEETLFIAQLPTTTCAFYWTSGIERPNWVWDIYTGFPIYDSPAWCDPPALPQCAALQPGENLRPMDCTTTQCTLCEQKS